MRDRTSLDMPEGYTPEDLIRVGEKTVRMKVASRKFLNWLVSGPGPNTPGIEALAELRKATEDLEKEFGE